MAVDQEPPEIFSIPSTLVKTPEDIVTISTAVIDSASISEIAELDLLRIRHAILKSGGKMATVSWLLGFYRTLIRFAVQANLSPALEYQIPSLFPKPQNSRIV